MQLNQEANQLRLLQLETKDTTSEILCPSCESRNCSSAGSVKRKTGIKPQHRCKDCKKKFVQCYEIKTKYWRPEEEVICPNCGSQDCGASGMVERKAGNKQQYRCRECKIKFVNNPERRTKYWQRELEPDRAKVLCIYCESKDCIKKGLGRNGKQRYHCKDCKRLFTEGNEPYRYVHAKYLDLSEDVWDASELGLRINKHDKRTKLIFIYIQPNWLKVLTKRFISFIASQRELQTLHHYISTFNSFSEFVTEYYPWINITDINRDIIINYITYSCQVSPSQRRTRLSALKLFFETGTINKWFDIPAHLIRIEDYPKQLQRLPRYIPEEVMQQLNQHLDALPEPVMRMVLVIQETGMRVGELLQLPVNCLKQDGKGDYYIQFVRWKMLKESTLPLSPEIGRTIQEQQQYIRENLDNKFDYLFCARTGAGSKKREFTPKPAVMHSKSFIFFLKDLASEFDIKDSSGKRWNFQSHQFRHTVGTRMINAGVPQHIVQRYLGHTSPTMTAVYAHIYDETLKKEVAKYHETRVVDIVGETIELEHCPLESGKDLEWFKKNVLAMALPHGYCGRPKVLGKCTLPPNSCLNCAYLRTNKNFLAVFRDELKRTNEVLAKAKKYEWEIQISMNEIIKENLEKLIKSLEAEQ